MTDEEPTEKQLKFIKDIELTLAKKFTGKTKQDAFNFIAENKESFYKQKDKELNAKMHLALEYFFKEEYYGRFD